MNMYLLIGIVAGIVQLYAIIPYAKSILARETRPNIVSWILWTLLQLVAIWIQATSGEGFSWSLFLLLAMTFNTSLVVVLCLAGYGDKEFGIIEGASLMLVAVAAGLYAFTRNGPWAIGLNIVGDLIAASPTIVKTWRDPKSEAVGPWAIVTVAAALAVISVENPAFETVGFPAYLICANGLIAALAYIGQKKTTPVT
jgi:hypothetical protein